MAQARAVNVLYAGIDATADGVNILIAATAGKRITVIGYALNGNAAGTLKFQDTAGTPVVHATFRLQSGEITYAGSVEAPAFSTAEGVGLNLLTTAALDGGGHLTYILE